MTESNATQKGARQVRASAFLATAVVLAGHSITTATADIWRYLPEWWSDGDACRRLAWLDSFFRQRLKLEPGDQIIAVTLGSIREWKENTECQI